MAKKNGRMAGMFLWFMMMALIILPVQVGALDTDNDGFTDAEEAGNILGFAMNPNVKDLFVILVRSTTTYIPTDPLLFIYRTQQDGGLGIATHEISEAQAPNRNVTSTQKAIRITESSDTSDPNVLGISNCGTPNGLDLATVFTLRIIDHVYSVCASVTDSNCVDADGVTIGKENIIKKYIKHTIAHEAGHMMTLRYLDTTKSTDAKIYNSIGNHYQTGTGVILDQSVKYTSKGGKVTFYLGTTFTSADQSAVRLK